MASTLEHIDVLDLGRCAYADAYARQLEVHERVLGGQCGPTLLLVEHDPVITVSQRRHAAGNILADDATLARLGIEVQPTNRGGDVTYHGPGQLVAYPIFPLAPMHFNVGRYIRFLETVIIDTAATFNIAARRIDGCTGVWVTLPHEPPRHAKLAAIGVRVKRNITLHGLAINVHPDLSHFQTIIPCGLANRRVTSVRELLDGNAPDMDEVKAALVEQLRRQHSDCLAAAAR